MTEPSSVNPAESALLCNVVSHQSANLQPSRWSAYPAPNHLGAFDCTSWNQYPLHTAFYEWLIPHSVKVDLAVREFTATLQGLIQLCLHCLPSLSGKSAGPVSRKENLTGPLIISIYPASSSFLGSDTCLLWSQMDRDLNLRWLWGSKELQQSWFYL